MVQTQSDGATPLSGALRSLNYLNNAKTVYITQDYTHGAFPYDTQCVDGTVSNYILTDVIPTDKITTCIGHSLNTENSANGKFDEGAAEHVYKNPVEAKETIDKIHNTIINAEKLNLH